MPPAGLEPAPACPAPDSTLKLAIIEAAGAPRLLRILALASTAGLRSIEVARVRVDDVWLGPCGYMLTVVGKGDRTRHVPIDDWLARDLLPAGHNSESGWIFPGQIDGHLSECWVGRLAYQSISHLTHPNRDRVVESFGRSARLLGKRLVPYLHQTGQRHVPPVVVMELCPVVEIAVSPRR